MTAKAKKLSLTKLWMMTYPDDVPCPHNPAAAAAWRRKRFGSIAKADADRAKYEELMAETKGQTT
jgi:hypothetical protein